MKSVFFTDFTNFNPLCAPIKYTATLSDGVSPIDFAVFTFIDTNKEL